MIAFFTKNPNLYEAASLLHAPNLPPQPQSPVPPPIRSSLFKNKYDKIWYTTFKNYKKLIFDW